ncbi:saccharopine dehydrogenase NADP-binding domain-containing protein, partial [Fischerella thermalis]
MSLQNYKKILVVGGTGVAGKFIVNDILKYIPNVQIDIGSRNINTSFRKAYEKIGKVKIDINDSQAAIKIIKNYDLVIFALGPFGLFGNRPHKICCEAGVDCIDINDEIDVTMNIFALDEFARAKGVKILTGMGLCPGLTTLLLLLVLKTSTQGEKILHLRLFLNRTKEIGLASVQTALNFYRQNIHIISNGSFCCIENNYNDELKRDFLFPNFDNYVPIIYGSSSEAFTLKN